MSEDDPGSTAELALQLLVLRCQAGDERAFGRLFAQFGPRTLRYLRGLAGQAAEDLQQEVWLTVYRSIATLANPRAFRTWLFRITRHRVLDWLRRGRRERELLDEVVRELPGEAETATEEISEEMLNALEALPPAQREVCLLRYRDGLSYAEIALVTGGSVGTVRSRLHYARQRLRELILQRASTSKPGVHP